MGRARTGGIERREHPRYAAMAMRVDYSDGENFLLATLGNISAMGIFIHAKSPLPVGTFLRVVFALEGGTERLALDGEVTWINPPRGDDSRSAGMGVRFVSLTAEQREAVFDLVRAVAYLPSS